MEKVRPIRHTKRNVVPIHVRAGLEIPQEWLSEKLRKRLEGEFTYPNPERIKKQRLGLWLGATPATISTFTEDEDFFRVPRGGRKKLEKILEEEGVNPEWNDLKLEHDPIEIEVTDRAELITLRPEQEDFVTSILASETCLIRAPTSTGKTEIAIEVIKRLRQPSLVIVWSSGLMKQ